MPINCTKPRRGDIRLNVTPSGFLGTISVRFYSNNIPSGLEKNYQLDNKPDSYTEVIHRKQEKQVNSVL